MHSVKIRDLYIELRAVQIGIWEAENTKNYENYDYRLKQARNLFNDWMKTDLGRDPTNDDRAGLSWLICNIEDAGDPELEELAKHRWIEIQDSVNDAAWRQLEEAANLTK